MQAAEPERAHRKLGLALIAAGCVLAIVAIFAIWVNRQALNTDNWTNTSSKMLEDKEIRAQLSNYLVDQLYANNNVTRTGRECASAARGGARRPDRRRPARSRHAHRQRAASATRECSSCGRTRTERRTSSCWLC